MPEWKVVHYNHQGIALGEAFPNSPEFAIYLDKVGYLTYDIDMSSPLCNRTNTEAYGTDFVLQRGNQNVIAGLHTNVGVADIEGHTLKVSGKDWLHYFERRFWQFDPVNPLANVYLVTGRDIALVVSDIIAGMQAQPNSLQFDLSQIVAIGQTTNYKIDVQDTENLFSKLEALAQTSPGFDFDVSPDLTRIFRIYAPKKGAVRTLTLEQGSNIYDFNWTDNGPNGTHTLASATGGSSKIATVLENASITRYRRLDVATDFNNVTDATSLGPLAQGESDRNGTPTTEFTVKLVPDYIDNFLNEATIGDQISVYANNGYETIDSVYRLVSIVGRPDDEGNEEYELGFDSAALSL